MESDPECVEETCEEVLWKRGRQHKGLITAKGDAKKEPD